MPRCFATLTGKLTHATTKTRFLCPCTVAQPGRGDISGTYVGADALAAAVVGVGGNVLLGGSNNSIALQPISIQATTGVIVAAGLERMDLQPGQ